MRSTETPFPLQTPEAVRSPALKNESSQLRFDENGYFVSVVTRTDQGAVSVSELYVGIDVVDAAGDTIRRTVVCTLPYTQQRRPIFRRLVHAAKMQRTLPEILDILKTEFSFDYESMGVDERTIPKVPNAL